jgi:hypothetical protein
MSGPPPLRRCLAWAVPGFDRSRRTSTDRRAGCRPPNLPSREIAQLRYRRQGPYRSAWAAVLRVLLVDDHAGSHALLDVRVGADEGYSVCSALVAADR